MKPHYPFQLGDLVTLNPIMFPYEDAIVWLGLIVEIHPRHYYTAVVVEWIAPERIRLPEHIDYLTLVNKVVED
jgi:hypothetical protein